MTRQRWMILGMVVVAVLGGAAWLSAGNDTGTENPYRLATIERGDVEETVASTGTVTAVQTVAIGTQVSGQVIELYADFNDSVEEGELLARIDPTLQRQRVREAEASLERAQADLKRTQQDYDRNATLFEQQVITESEFSEIEYRLAVTKSSVTSAEIGLEQARQNLSYTEIYAPIDGVVIERNAEVGQTVAASLSTPQLFLLANDLSQLEILASVDESDIGMIEPGQLVRFEVQAYPDEIFEGRVRQVRLQSSTTENVVNYTTVITVDNPDRRLLPGMTATVDFIVKSASDVFKVANAALRFTPTPEMLEQLEEAGLRGPGQGGEGGRAARADGAGANAPDGNGGGARTTVRLPRRNGGGAGGQAGGPPQMSMLWFMKDGVPAVMPVRAGISDGVQTEIEGPEVEEGLQVIAGVNIAGNDNAEQTTNPFQQRGFSGGGNVRFRQGF